MLNTYDASDLEADNLHAWDGSGEVTTPAEEAAFERRMAAKMDELLADLGPARAAQLLAEAANRYAIARHLAPTLATVLLRATFKNPDAVANALGHEAPSPEQAAAIVHFIRYGEYLTVELLSDGTARVVPVSEH